MTTVLFSYGPAEYPCTQSEMRAYELSKQAKHCESLMSFFFFALSYKFPNWKQIPVLLLAKTEMLPGERDLLCHNARAAPC